MENFTLNLPDNLEIHTKESELRFDPFGLKEVVVSPQRLLKDKDRINKDKVKLSYGKISERLLKAEAIDGVYNNDNEWVVKSIENEFPIFNISNDQAKGYQELTIDINAESDSFGDIDIDTITSLFELYTRRLKYIETLNDISYVLIFKNEGIHSGASVAQPHSQIFGLNNIPLSIEREYQEIKKVYEKSGKSLYEEYLLNEIKAKSRIVKESLNFIVHCDYASEHPLEITISSKDDIARLNDLDNESIIELSSLCYPIVQYLSEYDLDYNMTIVQGLDPKHRLKVKFIPRGLSIQAGFEKSTGIIANKIPPEDAAIWYREMY